MIEIWMRNHLLSDHNYNTVNYNAQFFFYNEWQFMLGLQSVLVTSTWAVTISIEQDK